MNGESARDRQRPVEAVAGLMAACALFAGSVALVYRPIRLGPAAVLVALIAVGIGGRHSRLAAAAVAIAAACLLVGLMMAVITENPLY